MPKNNNGQVLLLVLLSVASILVIAMSVVSQSISDIRVSTQEEESIRALNAAEAGLEEVLNTNALIGSVGDVEIAQKDSNFNTVVESFGNTDSYQYPRQLSSGETATIWFKEHDSDGNFEGGGTFAPERIGFCWGNPYSGGNPPSNNPEIPALEVIFFYDDGTGMKTKTMGFDPNNSRESSTEFLSETKSNRKGVSDCNFNDFENTIYKVVDVFADTGIDPSNLQFAVLRMLYNPTPQYVGVKMLVGGALPSQGRKIDSIGTSGVSTRRVELNLLYSDAPSPFTSAIVSRRGIGQ